MDKMILLFEEYLLKAVTMTETELGLDVDADRATRFTENRERLFQIIDKISREVDWAQVSEEKRTFLSRQIDYINKLDEKLLVKLQEHQIEAKKEIEVTHKQNESIKGYNLNDVK